MKLFSIALVAVMLPSLVVAQDKQDAQEKKDTDEIRAMILKNNGDMKQNKKLSEPNVSARGAHDFWSSGGLLVPLSPDFQFKFDNFNLTSKHITIIPLVPGKAAVAAYYNEGSFKPVNGAAVDNYLCRVTTVFVNEDGKWKARHSHYSPVQGGSGTSQNSPDE